VSETIEIESGIRHVAPSRPEVDRSDRRLLQAVRRGDPDAVEALIERHWDRAHRIAYGILGDTHWAEDVTQEAMLSVIGNIGRFDPYRPFGPWLHKVVSNRALDWARARARRAEVSASGEMHHLVEFHADRAAAIAEQDPFPSSSDPDLDAALAALTPEHRAVIVLRFVAGYGPKQIGQVLGVPTGTVGSRLRRALDQLRTELEVDREQA
jgi:RNA polymerase sigma-70 factor, ECF subfamily